MTSELRRPRVSVVLFAAVIVILATSSSLHATASTPASPPSPSSSPSSSSSSSLSTFFPALTALLQDLLNHPVTDDTFLSRAQRNARFFMSAMVSPLQLLDFSHFAKPPLSSPFLSRAPAASELDVPFPDTEAEGWQQLSVAAVDAEDGVDDEEQHRLQGDISHALRVSVNAHRQQGAVPAVPALQPSAASAEAASEQLTPSEHSFALLAVDAEAVGDVQQRQLNCRLGQRILFLPNAGPSSRNETLCYCPYDWQGIECEQRVRFGCPIRLVSPANRCDAIRGRPPPTSSASDSASESAYSLSPSSSSFFRFEPQLSGTAPPCVSVQGPTAVGFNFTCAFLSSTVREGWGDPRRYAVLSINYTQVTAVQPFSYAVLVANSSGGAAPVFALRQADTQLRLDIRIHNSAHPSQSMEVQLPLNASHVQYALGEPAEPLYWQVDPATMDRNLKRGGRLVLSLWFGQAPSELDAGVSRLPWQLYVEDGTFSLPGAARKVLLSRLQVLALVLVLLVVAALLGWRWWQRRQTAKMHALVAQQRGKQRSWFVQTD